MVLYIYNYWFKMLKRSKMSTIDLRHAHRQRIALWVISLVLAMQHTYIQSMLYLARFISFLLYKSLFIDNKLRNFKYGVDMLKSVYFDNE